MADTASLRVTIQPAAGGTEACAGPLPTGTGPQGTHGGIPCAGSVLHVFCREDVWVFTVPREVRACPLAWLVTGTDIGSAIGERRAFAGVNRRTVFDFGPTAPV